MYYPPTSTPSRREPVINTSVIQKILDDNVQLIRSIISNQQTGNNGHELQQNLQLLHKNLIYLATIADQANSSNSNPTAPPQQPGGPPQQHRGGPPPPPNMGAFPDHQQHSYPPPSQGQSMRGPPHQSMTQPPNAYMGPPPMGPGGAMMPAGVALPPNQLSQQPAPPPPVDDRVYVQQQQQRMPPYGYPPGPPQTPSQSMPPQSQQPQFSMPPGGGGGEYGPPRYDNVAPPQPPPIGGSGMPPNVGIDPNAGGMSLTGPHQAPPQAVVSGAPQSQQSIQSSGTPGGPTQPDPGVIQQQQSQAPPQTPSGPAPMTAEPSPKPQMTGSADQSLQQQTTHPIEEQPPSSTSSNLS